MTTEVVAISFSTNETFFLVFFFNLYNINIPVIVIINFKLYLKLKFLNTLLAIKNSNNLETILLEFLWYKYACDDRY